MYPSKDTRTQGDGSFVLLITNIEENEKTRDTKEWFSCVLKKLRNDTKEERNRFAIAPKEKA